jgi:tetratricopeptide (TPR) repeat protein
VSSTHPSESTPPVSVWLRWGWIAMVGLALSARLVDALYGPVLRGYDAVAHASYVFFIDLYHGLPFADQGWLYFHPPLHYAVGWLLAQTGSADAFVRGLAMWNGAASIGVALLTAAVVRVGLPRNPWLSLLAFTAVVFLPVHVYASAMPGNELTATLLGTAALATHIGNQRRNEASLGRDAVTGLLAGGALLGKYSGLVPLVAIGAQLALRALRPGLERRARGRLVARMGLILAVAVLVSGAYYARNVAEFGTPLPMKGHRPVLDEFESRQPPGERTWRDLVSISPRLLLDPSPLSPHMLHSIWGTFYAGIWVHLDEGGSNLPPYTTRTLLVVGLLPTALAALGLLLSLRTAWRDPNAHVETTLLLLVAAGLTSFGIFAFATPTFAALKPMYLLNLSAAYGYFLARAVQVLAFSPRLQRAVAATVVLAAVTSAAAYTPGLASMSLEETVQMAAVRSHFGDWEGASAIYRRELDAALRPPDDTESPRLSPFWAWGMLAATELAAGNHREAHALYSESFDRRPQGAGQGGALGRDSPFVVNRLAVATALAGDPARAQRLLDDVVAQERLPEFLVNHAALLARGGDLDAAEAELREALAGIPKLAPALRNLAWVLERRGQPGAPWLRREAGRAARRAPRGYPYGVGDGRGLNTQLFMLVLRGDELDLYRPARARPR